MDKDIYRKDNNSNNGISIPKFVNRENEWDQFSNKLENQITDLEDEDTFFDEINSSLARQISMDLEERATNTKEKAQKKRKLSKGLKIFAIVFSVIMILGGLLMFTNGGRKVILNIAGKYIYHHLEYQAPDITPATDDSETTVKGNDKPVSEVVNILLLGVEEIGGASNTDLMIIASMNTKDKTMKLTSLMRDLYVQIPGYSDNKLNSTFAKGGINLLYDTIENNFGVKMDGYVLVNFTAFEKIVDIMNGVEVTLTSNEANYLNNNNYISDPANRNVVTGTQIMNGNQAMGYCRVRYVSTGTESNDFGRTQRQRAVLNAMFDKIKSKNILQLGLLMNDILTKVTIVTDITQTEFNNYLEEAVSLKVNELQNLRIPSDGNYESARVQLGKYNQDVLQPTDWDATREEIRHFIYGNITSNETSE